MLSYLVSEVVIVGCARILALEAHRPAVFTQPYSTYALHRQKFDLVQLIYSTSTLFMIST